MSAEAAVEVKKCLHCPKQLRSNNLRGICSDCSLAGKADVNGKTKADLDHDRFAAKKGGDVVKLPRRKSMNPPPKAKRGVAGDGLTALERFRIVVDALQPAGMNADQVLEQFAQEYLESLTTAAAAEE